MIVFFWFDCLFSRLTWFVAFYPCGSSVVLLKQGDNDCQSVLVCFVKQRVGCDKDRIEPCSVHLSVSDMENIVLNSL